MLKIISIIVISTYLGLEWFCKIIFASRDVYTCIYTPLSQAQFFLSVSLLKNLYVYHAGWGGGGLSPENTRLTT